MDATADPMITFDGVQKKYPDGTTAVHDLSIEIAQGEICVIVGPSGCGKTTAMRMINRLVEPTSGTITVGGQDVSQTDPQELRRHIGYVIQQIGLFPHHTIRRNVACVRDLLGLDKASTAIRVDELLDLVGLEPDVFGDRYPHQLSGGQRQRVGVARALAADPPVLLMDEPFGAVDPVARERLQREFLNLQSQVKKTIVFVTHDIDEAMLMGDRIAVMREGGYLEQYAPPAEVLANPASDFVRTFVGGDRLVKLLAVTTIPETLLAQPGPGDHDLPRIDSGASLREALGQMLDCPEGLVLVTKQGDPLGTLSVADVHAHVRASV